MKVRTLLFRREYGHEMVHPNPIAITYHPYVLPSGGSKTNAPRFLPQAAAKNDRAISVISLILLEFKIS